MPESRGAAHPKLEPKVDGSGPLILIVDDDHDNRETMRMVLEEEGYIVELAQHGAAALVRLKREPSPTLLLVDLMMPVMDGPALLAALEASADLSHIPVVVVTASGPDPRTSGLRYPVLRKPFQLDELMRIVTELSPRLWDDEEGTDETSVPDGVRRPRFDQSTPRVLCSKCPRIASARCVACGEAFCRHCLDAGPDGRCAKCWRAAHP